MKTVRVTCSSFECTI